MTKLTDLKIRQAKAKALPYQLPDGGGLYLEIRPTGAKIWRYRFRLGGKATIHSIGAYNANNPISLTNARELHTIAKKLVIAGINPNHNRQDTKDKQAADRANTFESVAEAWIAEQCPHWTPRYLKQVSVCLKSDVYPLIGAMPIKHITSANLLAVIKPVATRAPTVAINIKMWIRAVFHYAIRNLLADTDPTYPLKGIITKPKTTHHKPLSQSEIAPFLKAVSNYGGMLPTKTALRLLLLTFVRPGELRAASWSEFDLDNAVWTIPAERMKMRQAHIVPLSRQAVALLKELYAYTGHLRRRLLFPNIRTPDTCMTMTTLNRALEYMGYAGRFSAHGFRATASSMLNEIGYNSDWIERQLAHAPRNKVRASYNHAQWLKERAKMMQEWADLIDGLVADAAEYKRNIVPLYSETLQGKAA